MQPCSSHHILQASDRMTGSNPMSPGSSGELSPFDLSGELEETDPCSPIYDMLDSSQQDAGSAQRWDSHAEMAEQAKHEAEIENRIAELRKEGFWHPRRLSKVPEPTRPKVHWDYLCEEMQWLSADFAQERRWKRGVARKLVRMVVRHHEEQKQKEERARREEQAKLKRIAISIAKEVRQFWSNVEKVVQFKQQSRLEERRKKALDLQLDFIVGQTEKYSDLLSQSLSEVPPASKTSSSCIGSSHGGSLGTSPTPSVYQRDDRDFLPHEEEDDEETIEIEEQQDGNDEESQRLEIELLKHESELPLEELLQSMAPEFLEDEEDDEQDVEETVSNHIVSELDEDDEFTANEDEAEDEEDTIAAEEAMEGQQDHTEEISLLAREGEMSLEDLLKKYSFVRTPEESPESCENEQSGDESGSTNYEASDSEGVEFLVKSEDDSSTDPLQQDNSEPKKEITDIAATAESLQPKGYTLATTQVKTEVPFLLHGDLREYQHIGLEWLVTMYEKKLNGILADEMGLGKTIQTISLLAHLACEKGNWGPHLIIVPTSVILNWEMELKRWCPSFKILTYYGSQKERKLKRQGWTKVNAFHVCITSYKLVLQDHQAFRRKNWKYLILDEAQNIKNFKSQRWQSLLNFNSQRRLLLTGTPLQNSLMELWSLMHFLMPHVFQSHREFKEWFSNPLTGMIEGSQEYNEGLVRRLHKVLRPFLLRRIKLDVEKQMPKKYEHVIYCRLSKRQRYLYDDFMAQAATRETLASGHFMSVINILMQLRKVCNHPNLFDPRPIHSPFITSGVSYSVPSLVLRVLQQHPLQHVDLALFDLINIEGHVCRYGSEIVLQQYKPSRSLIQEISDSPEPPPRPRPVKMKVNRMLPVARPESRTAVVNSPHLVNRSSDLPPTSCSLSLPTGVPAVSTSMPSSGSLESAQQVPPAQVIPMVQPSAGSSPMTSAASATAKPVQAQSSQSGSSTTQRLVLTPDMQARLSTGEVISLSQLASLTSRPLQSPAVTKPLTLQLQGAKLTLSGAQVRQLGVNQPRPIQGNVLHLVSSGGQHHLLGQPAQLALIQALAQQSAATPQLIQGGGSAPLGVQTLSLQSLPHSLLANANLPAPSTPCNPLQGQVPSPGVVRIVVRQAARDSPTAAPRAPLSTNQPQTARPLLRVLPGTRSGVGERATAPVGVTSALALTSTPLLMVSSPALASRLPSPVANAHPVLHNHTASNSEVSNSVTTPSSFALRPLAPGASSALQFTNSNSSPPRVLQSPSLNNCPASQIPSPSLTNCPLSQTLIHDISSGTINKAEASVTNPALVMVPTDAQACTLPNGNGFSSNSVPPDTLSTQLPSVCVPVTNTDSTLYLNPLLSRLSSNPPSPPVMSASGTSSPIIPKLAPQTYNFSLVPALLTNSNSSAAPVLAAPNYNSVPTRFLSSPVSLLALSPLPSTSSSTTSILYTHPSSTPLPTLAVPASVPVASLATHTSSQVPTSSVVTQTVHSPVTTVAPPLCSPIPEPTNTVTLCASSHSAAGSTPAPLLTQSAPVSTPSLLTHRSASLPLLASLTSPVSSLPSLVASGSAPLPSLTAIVSGPTIAASASLLLPPLAIPVSSPLPLTTPVSTSHMSLTPLVSGTLSSVASMVSKTLPSVTSVSPSVPPLAPNIAVSQQSLAHLITGTISSLAPPISATVSVSLPSHTAPVTGIFPSLVPPFSVPLPSLSPPLSDPLPLLAPPISDSLPLLSPVANTFPPLTSVSSPLTSFGAVPSQSMSGASVALSSIAQAAGPLPPQAMSSHVSSLPVPVGLPSFAPGPLTSQSMSSHVSSLPVPVGLPSLAPTSGHLSSQAMSSQVSSLPVPVAIPSIAPAAGPLPSQVMSSHVSPLSLPLALPSLAPASGPLSSQAMSSYISSLPVPVSLPSLAPASSPLPSQAMSSYISSLPVPLALPSLAPASGALSSQAISSHVSSLSVPVALPSIAPASGALPSQAISGHMSSLPLPGSLSHLSPSVSSTFTPLVSSHLLVNSISSPLSSIPCATSTLPLSADTSSHLGSLTDILPTPAVPVLPPASSVVYSSAANASLSNPASVSLPSLTAPVSPSVPLGSSVEIESLHPLTAAPSPFLPSPTDTLEPPLSLTVAGPSAVSVTLSTAPETELVLEGDGYRSALLPCVPSAMRHWRQLPPPPRSPFYLEPLEERRRKQKVERLDRIHCLNDKRCGLTPVYGIEILQLCNFQKCGTSADKLPEFWLQTSAINRCILTPEERLEQLRPLIERFIFAMPPVEAPQISLHTSHPPPSLLLQESVFKKTLSRKLTPRVRCLHRIVSNMRTQFPDLRLIQYDCGKLQTLDVLLRQLKSGGHRVLLFTQMTRMLNVLEQFLTYHGHIYLRLDGSTRIEQRQVLMERFNMDKRIFCFILSTRSGGVGVNLTGADTVIFYDSDWNPTMDAQAQDRCHRIGQTRDVHIYRLVSERTVEENILKKAQQKRMLGDMAIEGGNFTTAYFKQQTIRELFDMEDSSRREGENRVASPVHTAEDDNTSQKAHILEQALCGAEDEEDTLAASLVRAEQVADEAEFSENAPLEAEEEEQSRAEQEIRALVEQLTPIERYAMNYLEATLEDVSREELKQAEEQVEAARKDLFFAKDERPCSDDKWEEESRKLRRSRATPPSRPLVERVGARVSERLRVGKTCDSADLTEDSGMVTPSVEEQETLQTNAMLSTSSEITTSDIVECLQNSETVISSTLQQDSTPSSPSPTFPTNEISLQEATTKEESAEEPILSEDEENVPEPNEDPAPTNCSRGISGGEEVGVPRTPRRKVTADCEILLAGAGESSPTAKVLRRLPGRLVTVVHDRPLIPRRQSRGRGYQTITDCVTQSPDWSDPQSPPHGLQSDDNSEAGSPPPKRKRGRPPKTRADLSPIRIPSDVFPAVTSPIEFSTEVTPSPLENCPEVVACLQENCPEVGASSLKMSSDVVISPLETSSETAIASPGLSAPWSPGSCLKLNCENESVSGTEKRKRGRPPKRREGSITSPVASSPPLESAPSFHSPPDTSGADRVAVPIHCGPDYGKDGSLVTFMTFDATADDIIPSSSSNIPHASGCGEGTSSSGADEPSSPPKRKRGRPPKSQPLPKKDTSTTLCIDREDSSPDRSPSPQITRTPDRGKKWQPTAGHCEAVETASPSADTDSSGDEEVVIRTPLTRSARSRLQSQQVPLLSSPDSVPTPKSPQGRSPRTVTVQERPSIKQSTPRTSSPNPPSLSPLVSASERQVVGGRKRVCPPVERVLRSSLTASPANNTRSSRPSTLLNSPCSHRGRKAKT
ncbi:helicase SRCAP [Bombina bombina]|uniref:helicase SRCAP n=1 Tax=Bombina bombina TaxID=8345 RepID=UPI00235AD006|nr:helicase SRCAP [Bombina bombina]